MQVQEWDTNNTALDPSHPDTLYLILDHATDPNHKLGVASNAQHWLDSVHQSSDGGITWTGKGNKNFIETRLTFSEHEPRTLFAATKGSGLFRGALPCDQNRVCESDEVAGICSDCVPPQTSGSQSP